MTDASGNIQVAIFKATINRIGNAGHFKAEVKIPDETFVAISGGFEGSDYPGQYLVSSMPDLNYSNSKEHLQTWKMMVKDHSWVDNSPIEAYAVGLRINGISATELKNKILVTEESASKQEEPYATRTLSKVTSNLVIGGGMEVRNYTDNVRWFGQLAVSNAPTANGTGWRGASKQHEYHDQRALKTFLLELPRHINNLTLENVIHAGNYDTSQTSYVSADLNDRADYVLTSCGAESSYGYAGFEKDTDKSESGAAKFITTMKPSRGGKCEAVYKDLNWPDNTTRVRAVVVGLKAN
jgi:hypothetical protein